MNWCEVRMGMCLCVHMCKRWGCVQTYLVHDVLVVNGHEDASLDDCVQVSVHKLKHQIDINVILSLDHIQKLNNIVMSRELLKNNKNIGGGGGKGNKITGAILMK